MNYYELLGIKTTATEEEIRKAYKAQMKKWHPDINKDSEAVSMSMKINEAKDVLLDDVKRKEYDKYLNEKDNITYKRYSGVKAESYSDTVYESQMVTGLITPQFLRTTLCCLSRNAVYLSCSFSFAFLAER